MIAVRESQINYLILNEVVLSQKPFNQFIKIQRVQIVFAQLFAKFILLSNRKGSKRKVRLLNFSTERWLSFSWSFRNEPKKRNKKVKKSQNETRRKLRETEPRFFESASSSRLSFLFSRVMHTRAKQLTCTNPFSTFLKRSWKARVDTLSVALQWHIFIS